MECPDWGVFTVFKYYILFIRKKGTLIWVNICVILIQSAHVLTMQGFLALILLETKVIRLCHQYIEPGLPAHPCSLQTLYFWLTNLKFLS